MTDKESFYSKLKIQLEDTTVFPADYMYKFIVPSAGDQEIQVKDLFKTGGPVIQTKKSKNGKYISISILMKLKNADEVIGYYKKAEKIEGIISL